jgi:hypothetical protein
MKPSLRLWPGVVAVVIQWLAWFVVPVVAPDIQMYGLFTGFGMGFVVLLWWLFFSRAPWLDRVVAIAVMPVVVLALRPRAPIDRKRVHGEHAVHFLHPVLSLALVSWAAATPAPRLGAASLAVGAGAVPCERSARARPHRWHQGVSRIGLSLAVDAGRRKSACSPRPRVNRSPLQPAPAPPTTAAPVAAPPRGAGRARRGSDCCEGTRENRRGGGARAGTASHLARLSRPNRDSILRGVELETDWSKVAARGVVAPAVSDPPGHPLPCAAI